MANHTHEVKQASPVNRQGYEEFLATQEVYHNLATRTAGVLVEVFQRYGKPPYFRGFSYDTYINNIMFSDVIIGIVSSDGILGNRSYAVFPTDYMFMDFAEIEAVIIDMLQNN